LAEEAFNKLFLFSILKYFYLLVFGYFYAGEGIENALKRVFEDKAITAPSYATSIGTKIGIITATVEPLETHLFTNYNGIGGERAGYLVPKGCENVRTWEV
jgi:hypothetical protein